MVLNFQFYSQFKRARRSFKMTSEQRVAQEKYEMQMVEEIEKLLETPDQDQRILF